MKNGANRSEATLFSKVQGVFLRRYLYSVVISPTLINFYDIKPSNPKTTVKNWVLNIEGDTIILFAGGDRECKFTFNQDVGSYKKGQEISKKEYRGTKNVRDRINNNGED